jgi:hypothetical protein
VRAAAGPAFILPLFSGMPQAAGLHRPARWLSWAARSGCCSQAGRIFCRTRPGICPAGFAAAAALCHTGRRNHPDAPGRQARGRYAASVTGGPCLPQKAKYGGRLRRRNAGRLSAAASSVFPAARAAQNKKGAFHSRAPKGTGTYGK